MNFVRSWWDWSSQSLGHTFAGVTAPLLLLAGFTVVLFYSSQGGDGASPLPPRSDIAGVCVTTTSGTQTASGCSSTVSPTGVQVLTPTAVPPTPTPKPRTYTVQAGDTLSVICANEAPNMTLDACVESIVKLSNLGGPDELAVGQSLRLPPVSATSTNSATTATRPTATSTPVVVADAPATEVVTEPEPTPFASLTAVGATEEPTAEPEVAEEPTVEPEAEAPSDEEIVASEGSEYVIESGDSLLGICVAQVPDMDEDECVEFVVLLNDLSGPDQITAGQTIFLP